MVHLPPIPAKAITSSVFTLRKCCFDLFSLAIPSYNSMFRNGYVRGWWV